MIAKVVINESAKELNRTFDYEVPEEFENIIMIGSKVLVPFAKMKSLKEGYVIGFTDKSQYETKKIAKVENIISEDKLKLAKWMARRYFCNVSEAVKLMLPPGTTTKIIENRIKEKQENFVLLAKDKEEIVIEIESGKIKIENQKKILNFLMKNDEIPVVDLKEFLNVSDSNIKTLQKNGYITILKKSVKRNPFYDRKINITSNLKLTSEQQIAFDKIEEVIDDGMNSEFLIFGVTGSGKTEIYLQLIDKLLKQGKSSIMLVPEISLTPQMIDRFMSRFGKEQIAVLHSKLSVGERFDEWNRINDGEAKVVIGARSAIFAPVKDLGIIIIDEEHDNSYKSEMSPRYDAKEIARKIALQNNCPLVLGSATPDLVTYYKAKNGEIELIELTKRANKSSLPDVEIVDLREELAKGNHSMISTLLFDKIQKNLEQKHQTILFLNRRGYSTFIMCRDCGYTVKCSNCNITMTYHLKQNKLKCHYCGKEQLPVSICPECSSTNIRYFGTGTQKLEQEINKIFPNATTIRMDVDTVTKKNSHEDILNKFKNENVDILIGTQMVVKGHHFPNVTLVGVIAADGSLNIEDYRANERTFQILTQVAGRAGRENLKGEVVIQTYNPDSDPIIKAAMQDYKNFYEQEIGLRKVLKYPPFCDIIVVGVSGKIEKNVIERSEKIYTYLNKKFQIENCDIQMFKPGPAPIDKIKNKYRWRIIIKGTYDEKINKILSEVVNVVDKSSKRDEELWTVVDINPSNMS